MLKISINDQNYTCGQDETWEGPSRMVVWALNWALRDARSHLPMVADPYPEKTQLETAKSRYPELEVLSMGEQPRSIPGAIH